MKKDELELLSLIRLRSRPGAEALYKAFASYIRLVIFRIVPCRKVTEEITLVVFQQIWNDIHKFPGNQHLYTWIGSIAKQKAIEYIDDQKTKTARPG